MEIDNMLGGMSYSSPPAVQTNSEPVQTSVETKDTGRRIDVKTIDNVEIADGTVSTNTKDNEMAKVPLPSEATIRKEIDQVNKLLAQSSRRLSYSIHEKTKHVMVKVVNTENDEVIREIPSEQTLDYLARLMEKTGILVDHKS